VRHLVIAFAAASSLFAADPGQIRYDCQSGEYLLVTYKTAGKPERAVLEVTGKPKLVLPQVISASGARYSDGYTVLWNKGDEVTLTSGEFNPKDCKERVLPAAGPLTPGGSDARSSLLGNWRVIEISGKAVAADRPAFIEFMQDGHASGSLGCNRFNGPYEVDGAKLKFGALISTKMAGPGPAMQIETDFSMALNATASWQLTQGQLTLRDPGGKTLAALKKD
jgi:heat shock protein HslJ/membrane-bound inhibitor of C-type lysozyme